MTKRYMGITKKYATYETYETEIKRLYLKISENGLKSLNFADFQNTSNKAKLLIFRDYL